MKNLLSIFIFLCTSTFVNAQISSPPSNFDQYGNSIQKRQIEIDRNGTVIPLIDPNEGNYPNNPPVDPQTDNERYVFWLHGLNGNIGSWIRAADASANNVASNFQARKLKSVTVIDYTQDANILGAAQQVGEQIEDKRTDQISIGENPQNNFIIAHSQGGVVGRGLLYRDICLNNTSLENLGYGGIVTFGTPNQGARILNNKEMFNTMATDMCSSLTAGPAEEISQKTILNLIVFKLNIGDLLPVTDIIENICNSFLSNVVSLVIATETPNITEGYKVGATDINAINNCSSTDFVSMPKVAFYGQEPEDGLFLRTAGYFLKSPNVYDYFDANDDNFFTDAFKGNKMKYDAAVAKWNAEYLARKYTREKICSPFQFPPQWFFCQLARKSESNALKILNGYKKGQDWFNRLDDQYKTIIGAIDYTSITQWYCVCENVKTLATSSTPISGPSACPSSYNATTHLLCEAQEETTFTQIKKISDGVVLAESAMNLPYATFAPQKLDNSSHMQMRNNEALRLGLKSLYDGGTDKFFKTEKK